MIGTSWKAKAARVAMLSWATIGFLLQRLMSPWGLLIVSLGLLRFSETMFGVTPLSLGELIETFKSEKELLGITFATIIAYAALSTWKDQKRLELKIAVGGEILAHFNEVVTAATHIVLYAEGMIKLRRMIAEEASEADVLRAAGHLYDDIGEYEDGRARLTDLGHKATAMRGTHYVLLSTSAISLTCYDKALEKLSKFDSSAWLVHPRGASDAHEFAQFVAFVPQETVDSWLKCSDSYHKNIFAMHGLAGAVNGKFVATLFPLTWTMLVDQWRTGRKLARIGKETSA